MTLVQPGGAAREQPATADRDDHHVRGGAELLDDLHRHRALAGDRQGRVEGRNQGGAGLLGVRDRGVGGLVVGVADDHHLDCLATDHGDPVALLARRVPRQVDHTLDAEGGTGVGHALAVVAGTGADHPARLLDRVELGDHVVGASHLVGADDLQVFAFEPDVPGDPLREPLVAFQRRTDDHPGQASGRVLDQVGIHQRLVRHLAMMTQTACWR